jgi:large subunit ribosomal protein L32
MVSFDKLRMKSGVNRCEPKDASMPVPKRKRSRARRDSRFANKGIKPKALTDCKNCKAALLPHQVCKNCGHYKGVKVLVTKAERTLKRNEVKQAQKNRTEKQTASAEQPSE